MSTTRITSRTLMDGILDRDSEMNKVTYPRLQKLVKEFETAVWFQGLQEQVRADSYPGLSDDPTRYDKLMGRTPVTLMSYVMAGRCMIQVERGDIFISMVADETSPDSRTGIQGIHATIEEAEQLLKDAATQWQTGRRPTSNPSVSMGF